MFRADIQTRLKALQDIDENLRVTLQDIVDEVTLLGVQSREGTIKEVELDPTKTPKNLFEGYNNIRVDGSNKNLWLWTFERLWRHMILDPSSVRVFHDAAQTLTTGVAFTLLFNSERWDTDKLHDLVTNNERLTVRSRGVYEVGANVVFAANATGSRDVKIIHNTLAGVATTIARKRVPTAPAGQTMLNINTQWEAAHTDYFILQAEQNSGGNLDIMAASAYSPEFWMDRVR